MTRLAIYAGTFDPLTLGHVDLIVRGSEIFKRLILAVVVEPPKDSLFGIEDRLTMARQVVRDLRLSNVEVTSFDGLLVNYARQKKAQVLIRGLRAYSDFEYEFQMALTNRKLAPDIETLFLMPNEIHSYVSSSTVREVARLGGDTRQFVPPAVQRMLVRRLRGTDRKRHRGTKGQRD